MQKEGEGKEQKPRFIDLKMYRPMLGPDGKTTLVEVFKIGACRFCGQEFYYPGDDYVDWIGLNGYNWDGQSFGTRQSFSQLFYSAYVTMRINHPSKPIMIAETGTHVKHYKPKWVLNTFDSVENRFRGIKALSWWSELWSCRKVKSFDSRIDSSPEALQAFKKGISDPYFLGKIPYR